MNGVENSALNGYFQVKNTQIAHNTFVNCDYAIRIDTNKSGNNTKEPFNLIVANNIMCNNSVKAYEIVTAPTGNSVSKGNIISLAKGAMTDNEVYYSLNNGGAPIDSSLDLIPF